MQNPTDHPILDPATAATLRATAALFDAILPVMHKPLNAETVLGDKPVTTADLGALASDLAMHYAGGDDGPIREPGDDVPSVSDVYTDEELCALLDQHRNSVARMGRYDMAADLNIALDRLSEQAEQLATARDTVQMLLDKLSFLGYGNCPRDEKCLLNHDHATGCVTSHSELARIRREADAAERIDE